jgi:hypothetical protein
MNNSQRRATWAFICTIVSTVCAAALPHIPALGPKYQVIGTVLSILGAIASALFILFNQSLDANHVSIPVGVAIDKGLVRRMGAPLQSVKENVDENKNSRG